RRLLVVERDPKELKNTKKAFEDYSQQMKQVYSDSLVKALLEVGTLRPHLVLLDATINEVFDVVGELKKRGTEVMVIVGEGQKELEKRATDAGAIGVLTRPIHAGPVLNHLGLVE